MSKIKRIIESDDYVHQHFNEYNTPYLSPPYSLAIGYAYVHMMPARGELQFQTSRHRDYQIKLGNLSELLEKIDGFIADNNLADLQHLLKNDFLMEKIRDHPPYDYIHTDTTREIQGSKNICSADYLVCSSLEYLAVNGHLPALLGKSEAVRQLVLSLFPILDLTKEEVIDFRNIDLGGASFKNAQLGQSDFSGVDLKDVDFSDADLSACTMQPEKLDNCKTYEGATLPKAEGFMPYWNLEMKVQLLAGLDGLKNYVNKLPENNEKRQCVDELYHKFAPILKDEEKQPTMAAKNNFIKQLELAKDTCATNRNLRYLIGEMIAFICMLGVGYIIAVKYKQKSTGHLGLFAQPKSESKVDDLLETVKTPMLKHGMRVAC